MNGPPPSVRPAPFWLDGSTQHALQLVANERLRQDMRFGPQDHPFAEWLAILMEEVGEAARAYQERDEDALHTETVQVAAVAVAMVESLLRNGSRANE